MPLEATNLKACPTIGIDIGKNTFHLIGLENGRHRSAPEVYRATRPTFGSPTCRVASSAGRRLRRGASPRSRNSRRSATMRGLMPARMSGRIRSDRRMTSATRKRLPRRCCVPR